jgi:hypothetical protein
MRFESTGVHIIDAPPAAAPVAKHARTTVAAAAQEAAEMQQVERDLLEQQVKEAVAAALNSESEMMTADKAEQEARMDLEKSHVTMQLQRQVLARAQQDRRHAAQTVAMVNGEPSFAAAEQLEAAEVEVEKATIALRAAATEAESKQKVAATATATATAAHNSLAGLKRASMAVQAAFREADSALSTLRTAVLGTSRAATARRTATRAAQAAGRGRRLS